ncbi:MAG: DUF3667 domain-containing protein [Gemmatimonadetes bacterium]|nr:DUF3667 domain-containing protein [Gemmatimonadota bacterium]
MTPGEVGMVTDCRNCGAALEGRYCSRCGQDSREPPEDVWGLFGFFAARFAGVESRAFRSVTALLFQPGRLTRAFLDGHRARYSGPVQIYLWCTAAFFVVQTFFPIVRLDTESGAVVSSLSAVSIGTDLSPETLQRLADQGTSIAVFAERFDGAVTAYFPVVLVALVAASALLMALLYRRESALKHAVFALHWTAFYFALEMVRQLFPRLGQWGSVASILSTLFALLYLYRAMRIVYERGRIGTVLRAFLTIIVFAALLGAWLWSTTAIAERLA